MPIIMGRTNSLLRECPATAELEFSSKLLGPARHVYSRCYTTELGEQARMIEGKTYLFHINYFSPTRELFVSDPDERYLGIAPRVHIPCMLDADGVAARAKEVRKQWKTLAAPVARRAANRIAKQVSDMAKNTAIVQAAIKQGLVPGAKMPAAAQGESYEATPAVRTAVDDDADFALLELHGG
jgi:hypothetical protein